MATYIIRRFIQGVVVLVLATFVIYSLLILTPGGPQDQLTQLQQQMGTNKTISKSYVDSLMKAYKLDRPYPLNYLAWVFDPQDTIELNQQSQPVPKGIDVTIFGVQIKGSGIITGDMGRSVNIARGVKVSDLLGGRIGNTLILMSTSLIISILIAFPLGIISAIRQYSRLDYAVTTMSFVGLAMPTFWLGLMLIIFLAVLPKLNHINNGVTWLPYLPPGNISDLGRENDIVNRIYHLILPVMVLSFVNVAGYSRFVRSSMLEVLRQDYVRTAWSKGLSQRVVILKHALRNALIPVITIVTLSLPSIFSGAIATETVFNYAGMGQLYANAVFQLDIPIVMGYLLLSTSIIILANILADVLYAVADPRIHYS